MLNIFGRPIVGWIKGSHPHVLYNPMGYGEVKVVIHDKDSNPLYDQPMIVENPGAIIICQRGNKIGLIPSYRFVGERIIKNSGDYVKAINENNLWEELVSKMGKDIWEAPRGIITSTKQEDLESLVIKTAKLEGLQEAGFKLDKVRLVGRVNANTTFFFHAQYVVHARIKNIGKAKLEDTELIGRAKLFTIEEISQMQKNGEFVDGLTLAAMALCGISLPFK